MMTFKSVTNNKYSKIQKSTLKSAKEQIIFTPSVHIQVSSPFSNRTATVTGKKVIFKHV